MLIEKLADKRYFETFKSSAYNFFKENKKMEISSLLAKIKAFLDDLS